MISMKGMKRYLLDNILSSYLFSCICLLTSFLAYILLNLVFDLLIYLLIIQSSHLKEDEEGTMSVECVGFSKGTFRWAASGGMDKTLKVTCFFILVILFVRS